MEIWVEEETHTPTGQRWRDGAQADLLGLPGVTETESSSWERKDIRRDLASEKGGQVAGSIQVRANNSR